MKKMIGPVLLFALLATIPFFVKMGYTLQIFVITFLYASWASSWNVIGGYAGQLALGNGLYIGIGAYVMAALFKFNNITPWVGMLIAGLIAGILSVVFSFPCFRLRGIYYALSTACFLQVGRTILIEEDMILGYKTGGAMGIKLSWKGGFWNMQFDKMSGYFYMAMGLLIFCLVVSYVVEHSRMGYYLKAINTNQDAAAALGVNVMKYKLYAQFITAFLTAVGGALYAALLQFVEPNTVLAYNLSTMIVLLVVVGGRGTLWGPVFGAFLMVPLDQILRARLGGQIAGLSTIIYGVVLMIVVMFLPSGLFPSFAKGFAFVRSKITGSK